MCRCCWPRWARSPEPTPAQTATTHEMIATAPTTLWSLTADRHRPGALAQSVERLGPGRARGARPDVQRHLDGAGRSRARGAAPRTFAAGIAEPRARLTWRRRTAQTLAGMLALSGVAAESMVQDVGWTMMDIGKRIERGLAPDRAAAAPR